MPASSTPLASLFFAVMSSYSSLEELSCSSFEATCLAKSASTVSRRLMMASAPSLGVATGWLRCSWSSRCSSAAALAASAASCTASPLSACSPKYLRRTFSATFSAARPSCKSSLIALKSASSSAWALSSSSWLLAISATFSSSPLISWSRFAMSAAMVSIRASRSSRLLSFSSLDFAVTASSLSQNAFCVASLAASSCSFAIMVLMISLTFVKGLPVLTSAWVLA
mmetsp:Transcript_62179/g.182303  ORF Transcript_62179/g.182303 Transcript_62179/m.182303 type:complete len:226 (-) Transcript_62179:1455-2132(-)